MRAVVAAAVLILAAGSAVADDARVATTRGAVEVQTTGGEWQPAPAGTAVAAGSRIAARTGATAQLAFADDARLELRADAVVVLGAGAVRATLERGTIEQDLADAPGPVRLRTAVAQLEQRGGAAIVGVDAGGATRIANLGGGTVKVRRIDGGGRLTGRAVTVTAGTGLVVTAATVAPVQPLPPAPTWATPAARAVAIAGRSPAIQAAFTPVAGVTRYRVEVLTSGGDPVLAVPAAGEAEAGMVAIHRLRAGRYTARIAAIDAAGFESEASAELPIEIIDLPAIASGRDELAVLPADAGDPTAAAAPPELDLGVRLMIPAALTCRFGDDAPASPVVVTRAGETALHCQRGGDELVAPPIVGRPLDVTVSAPPAQIPRRGRTTLRFTVRDPATAPAVDAIATGLRVHSIEPIGGELEVTVEPASAGGRLAELDLVLRDAPDVTLTRVALAIEAPVLVVRDRAPPPVARGARVGFELGAYSGFVDIPTDLEDGTELGNAADPRYLVTGGPTLGARFAIWPTAHVGIETEIGVTPTDYAGTTDTATVLWTRAHLAARLVRDGRFGIRAALGAGAVSLLAGTGDAHADTDAELHWGLGFTVALPWRLQVRLDARHLIGPARDAGYASMFELDLGVGVRLGD